MFNPRFLELVRSQLIRVLTQQPRVIGMDAHQVAPAARYRPEDVAVFIDLQNLHYLFKDGCRVPANKVNLPSLLKEFLEMHGLPMTEWHVITGIHDANHEPIFHESMVRRLSWLAASGAKVASVPLFYYKDVHTDEVRSLAKGVDVRLASDLLRAVADGLSRVVVFSNDSDLVQAIEVAGKMAVAHGRTFQAFSIELTGVEWPTSGKCGIHGLRGTVRLPMSVEFVRKFVRLGRVEQRLKRRGEAAVRNAAAGRPALPVEMQS